MDGLIKDISKNKKKYYDDYKKFMINIKNDENYRYYESWYSIQFNNNWFLKLWKSISKYNIKMILQIIEDKYMDYIIREVNWIVMSRLVDLNDKKFITIFGDRLSLEFTKNYNNIYNQLLQIRK
jgi:hypothetical protein